MAGQQHGEVVVDTLVIAIVYGKSVGGRQIDTRLSLSYNAARFGHHCPLTIIKGSGRLLSPVARAYAEPE